MDKNRIHLFRRRRETDKRYRRYVRCLTVILLSVVMLCAGCTGKDAEGSSAGGSGEQTAAADSRQNEAGSSTEAAPKTETAATASRSWNNMSPVSSMDLLYADQFSVDYYENDISLITIEDTDQFLLLPEGMSAPVGLPDSIKILQKPVKNIYLVATSAMDDFIHLDAMDLIALSGTKDTGWYLPEAKTAMEEGKIAYAGKYSAPDYEKILSSDCGLAVESTMIYHTPEVKEQLERLGIPVLVERSSYEGHPLGRMEWIRLYGVLTGKEAEAEQIFRENIDALSDVLDMEPSGTYIPGNAGSDENALSTMNMDFESFYAAAKDADVLIYNSTIDGELTAIDELCAKNQLFADFKAVKEGNVWCTGKNMFQETMGLGDMIRDMNAVFADDTEYSFTYLHQLK